MPTMMLKNVRIRFPAIAEPKAIGDGEPAYGGKFVIADGDMADQIDAAMLEAATQKWEKDAKGVLDILRDNKKVCFERKPYRSTKTGEVYHGFENAFTLGSRTADSKPAPTVFDEYGKPVQAKQDIERLIYDGCYVNAKVEFWAQDNNWGRRLNCSLLGVMFAGHGESFGGGSGPAAADDFVGMAKAPVDADDVL